ncbi:hypothetical protein ABFS83_03G110100 [Erythranthe nasuta]
MDCRMFEITLVSADDLPDFRKYGQTMKVYAKVCLKKSEYSKKVVTLKGDKKTTQKTSVDRHGETNPRWNFPIEYTFRESAIQSSGVKISIKLYTKRTLVKDKFIGHVDVPLKSLFDAGLSTEKIFSYTVAGTPYGKLNITYTFGEVFCVTKASLLKAAARGAGIAALVHGAWFMVTGDFSLLLTN